jgi:hypothetical protein
VNPSGDAETEKRLSKLLFDYESKNNLIMTQAANNPLIVLTEYNSLFYQ